MQTAGTHHFIERTYREGSQFQWVRETLVNAFEAGATRVEFSVEWQAVESKGVYRRMIADNGCGMTPEQLKVFFNTFGGGGKPIGGAHENFGVGSKTSLLPWNTYGMVVISWTNGTPAMIWVTRDPETEEYGLKLECCQGPDGDTLEEVYSPYEDPEHGCDWATVKPDWIQDHGTVIVLLGNGAKDDTVLGDPTRKEDEIKGISSFLNRRMWTIRQGVEVLVEEFLNSDRATWPPSEKIARSSSTDGRTDMRTVKRCIEGASYYIEYTADRATVGKVAASGTVPLKDGTEIQWFLWEGNRPKVQSYASLNGYIAALYENELYDVTAHHSTYRSFGISDNSVRSRLWLIIKPQVEPQAKYGVYPKADRNSLLFRGGPTAGGPLPINDWAGEFADNMPEPILQALRLARKGEPGTLDAEWRDRLAERFGARWRLARLRVRRGGSMLLDPTMQGPPKRQGVSKAEPNPNRPDATECGSEKTVRPRAIQRAAVSMYGKEGTTAEGEKARVGGSVPYYRRVNDGDLSEGMLAAWQDKDHEYPEGVVLLNVDHPVLRSVIEHWQLQYADHHAQEIEDAVIDVYGQVAVSKVAHSEQLKRMVPSQTVENTMRSEAALTMALLGLMAEDHLIATKVGGKFSKKLRPVSGRRSSQKPNDSQ